MLFFQEDIFLARPLTVAAVLGTAIFVAFAMWLCLQVVKLHVRKTEETDRRERGEDRASVWFWAVSNVALQVKKKTLLFHACGYCTSATSLMTFCILRVTLK